MAKSLDAWIHNFTVTECTTHAKGYTVYKIKSIVFPVFIPETLTCVTVWKRYNDVKKLRKHIVQRHKELQLRGQVPEHKDEGFFRRFDPAVIQSRKEHILRLLDFISQHPALYKCHAFVQFFESSHSPSTSPLKRRPAANNNIAAICDEIDVLFSPDFKLIDPEKDKDQSDTDDDVYIAECTRSHTNPDLVSPMTSSMVSSTPSSETASTCSEATSSRDHDAVWCDTTVERAIEAIPTKVEETPIPDEVVQSSDYIYEAALEFSDAVRAEVGHHYRKAFDAYKRGISKLIEGARSDVRAEERRVAKDKIQKYLARAEQIHDCYLSRDEVDGNRQTKPSTVNGVGGVVRESLELPLGDLGRYKVLKVVHSVMQVQDTGDRRIYIMKAIERPANLQSTFFPKNIPNMVPLLGYFKSDTTIYLLLQQASGGRLCDYIDTYQSHDKRHMVRHKNSLSSLFSEPHDETAATVPDRFESPVDGPFLEVLQKYKSSDLIRQHSQQSTIGVSEFITAMEQDAEIPAFDVLHQDMDVLDLVSCSKKLIRSVSTTLEHVQSKPSDDQFHTPITEILHAQDARQSEHSPINRYLKNAHSIPTISTETIRPKSRPRIPERSIKRWAAELATAVHNLHAQNIVCQDLHPGKLLLGGKGEVQLTFFVPTAERQLCPVAIDGLYVAAERPLTMISDWWSFGVILFELLTGASFVECHPGGITSYYDVQYPEIDDEFTIGADARDLLESLIQTDVVQRAGWSEVRQHRYFADVYWEDC